MSTLNERAGKAMREAGISWAPGMDENTSDESRFDSGDEQRFWWDSDPNLDDHATLWSIVGLLCGRGWSINTFTGPLPESASLIKRLDFYTPVLPLKEAVVAALEMESQR